MIRNIYKIKIKKKIYCLYIKLLRFLENVMFYLLLKGPVNNQILTILSLYKT